jgi:hypothetical protein
MSITVAVVLVMQMTADQIVQMVAVRNSFMTTVGSVNVLAVMALAIMAIAAPRGVDVGHRNCVLFDGTVLRRMMEMPIVKVINMAVMFHCRMTTQLAVVVVMILMNLC